MNFKEIKPKNEKLNKRKKKNKKYKIIIYFFMHN